MNTPNHTSKEWLLYCLNQGLGQREMARIAGVSPPTIRLWIKKHNIHWRTISESLLAQSDKVSARAKKIWSDTTKRQKQSETMKRVQALRKSELSLSARKNWAKNRDKIIDGIKRASQNPLRNLKLSEASKKTWENNEYRQLISKIITELWQTEYREQVTKKIKSACQTPEFATIIANRWKSSEYRQHMLIKLAERFKHPEALEKQSSIAKTLWTDKQYRDKQVIATEHRNTKIAKAISELWKEIEYRAKHAGISTDEFIARCITTHGDRFNYDSTRFTNWQNKINIICNTCGNELIKKPQIHIEHGYCEYCQTSAGQRTLYDMVTQHTPCLCNDRDKINPLELDIYIPSVNSAIEHHGLYWHSYNRLETLIEKTKHQQKWITCTEKGIRLLQFFDFEVIHKASIVNSMIDNMLHHSISIGARSLNIKNIDQYDSRQFFDANHLYGHRTAAITYGLYDGDIIMMAISFSKYRDGYEIIRMAAKSGYSIVGGVSKLIKHFCRSYNPRYIFTYADLRYSTGIGYQKVGFVKHGFTTPNYFYYKGDIILSRYKCQKHKLHKLLDNYDSNISEAENMFNNGYRRVWDAGHMKLKLTP